MKKLFLLVASILIVLSSCKKESEQWNEKWILYQDSLCKVALDSVFLFSSDSNYVKANGYYKVLYWESSSYSVGGIRNNVKFGLWKSFTNGALQAEERYNDKGELDGSAINYDSSTGDLFSIYHFVDGEQEGIQKEFHPKSILARVYTLHKSYNYRDEYICYNDNGNVLYQENFGNDGTGYYKEFRDDTLFREGAIIKDKFVGMHIKKEFFHGRNPLIEQTFYNNDGHFFKVKLFGNLKDAIETKGDSIVYDYDKNKTIVTTFLKGTIITSQSYNDTILF